MGIKNQLVPADAVLAMVNARLEAVTTQYRYAQSQDKKIDAEALAETKWQLAEFKMNFLDFLLAQADEAKNK